MSICFKCLGPTQDIQIKPLTYVEGYRVEATGLDICENCTTPAKTFEEFPKLLRLINDLGISCCPPDAVTIRYHDGWVLT